MPYDTHTQYVLHSKIVDVSVSMMPMRGRDMVISRWLWMRAWHGTLPSMPGGNVHKGHSSVQGGNAHRERITSHDGKSGAFSSWVLKLYFCGTPRSNNNIIKISKVKVERKMSLHLQFVDLYQFIVLVSS